MCVKLSEMEEERIAALSPSWWYAWSVGHEFDVQVTETPSVEERRVGMLTLPPTKERSQ